MSCQYWILSDFLKHIGRKFITTENELTLTLVYAKLFSQVFMDENNNFYNDIDKAKIYIKDDELYCKKRFTSSCGIKKVILDQPNDPLSNRLFFVNSIVKDCVSIKDWQGKKYLFSIPKALLYFYEDEENVTRKTFCAALDDLSQWRKDIAKKEELLLKSFFTC